MNYKLHIIEVKYSLGYNVPELIIFLDSHSTTYNDIRLKVSPSKRTIGDHTMKINMLNPGSSPNVDSFTVTSSKKTGIETVEFCH